MTLSLGEHDACPSGHAHQGDAVAIEQLIDLGQVETGDTGVVEAPHDCRTGAYERRITLNDLADALVCSTASRHCRDRSQGRPSLRPRIVSPAPAGAGDMA